MDLIANTNVAFQQMQDAFKQFGADAAEAGYGAAYFAPKEWNTLGNPKPSSIVDYLKSGRSYDEYSPVDNDVTIFAASDVIVDGLKGAKLTLVRWVVTYPNGNHSGPGNQTGKMAYAGFMVPIDGRFTGANPTKGKAGDFVMMILEHKQLDPSPQ